MKGPLEIRDLHVSVDGKQILKGVNLKVEQGEVHVVMGPNGSGKSTLAYVLMGHPKYKVDSGDVLFNGKSIIGMAPDERAKLGLFLAFQYPMEIHGVGYRQFLMAAMRSKFGNVSIVDFRKSLEKNAGILNLGESFFDRSLNAGFSGGEKKRAEILQMLMLKPEIAIFDETDSGLDIDSLKTVASAINSCRGADFGALVITHYQRLLNYIKPDFVHIFIDGKVSESGDHKLAEELDARGYDKLKEKGAA